MKKNTLVYIVGITLVLISACTKKEVALTPSSIKELGFNYSLEGSNSYDGRIRNYHQRFGTYILYNFNKNDAYWNVIQWDSTYRLIKSEPEYVDKQLDLIDSTFFRYYADSTLKKYLPTKFLLCSSILMYNNAPQLDGYLTGFYNTNYVYENFIVNWGNSRILNMKGVKDSVALFRGNINYGFLRLLDLLIKT
jgi:hypothetical protein